MEVAGKLSSFFKTTPVCCMSLCIPRDSVAVYSA